MPDAAAFSAIDRLRDGREVLIRALKPADQADLDLAAARISDVSLYRRFFAVRRTFSEQERKAFVDVDFIDHVALIAVADENRRKAIVGGGRYVVVQPGRAEVAFIVIDAYQGQGLGSALLRHLTGLARAAGLRKPADAGGVPAQRSSHEHSARCGRGSHCTAARMIAVFR